MDLNKDNLYKMYISENKSRKECSVIFGCSESLIMKRLSIYGIKKDRKNACKLREKTMVEKYGVKNAAQLSTNYFKNITKEETENIVKKRVKTFKERYTSEIDDKRKKTCLNRYGVNHYTKTQQYKNSVTKRAKKRSNYNIVWNKDELMKYINSFDFKPTIYELSRSLNYSYTVIGKHIREFELQEFIDSKRSQPNLYWHDLILEKLGLDLEYEGYIFGDRQRCDLYYEPTKIGIDINPTASHNTQFNVYVRKPIKNVDTNYHRRRAIQAEENGWLLYQIYDWDNEEKVLLQLKSLFGLNKSIYARKCSVKEISKEESNSFLEKYHLQGSIGSTYQFGLYFEKELVAVMTFGLSRFFKDADIELLRFCSKETVIGGASKLFKYAISVIDCNTIMTYSDMSKGHGNIYKILGFEFYKYAGLNALYAPEKPTGESLKTQEASRLFKEEGKGYKSCKEYFNSKKWYRINDAGNKIWLWKRF